MKTNIHFYDLYIQCPTCDYVHYDKDLKLLKKNAPCPNCGKKNETRITYLDMYLRQFIKAIESSKKNSENELTVILFCTFFEIMLEKFFNDLMRKLAFPPLAMDIILENNINITYRVEKLFKKITNNKFKQIIENESALRDFYDRWKKIKNLRNDLLHGKLGKPKLKVSDSEESLELTYKTIKVFVYLNNEYCVINI